MLEVERANAAVSSNNGIGNGSSSNNSVTISPVSGAATGSQLLGSASIANGSNANGNGHHASVFVSMNHDEYKARTNRESVLQRLSEALLRRSLAKVGNID